MMEAHDKPNRPIPDQTLRRLSPDVGTLCHNDMKIWCRPTLAWNDRATLHKGRTIFMTCSNRHFVRSAQERLGRTAQYTNQAVCASGQGQHEARQAAAAWRRNDTHSRGQAKAG